MRLVTALRYIYLAYFSKPVSQRVLYRALRRSGTRKILEIGIGDMARTLRLLHLAGRLAGDETVRYAAIDLFEARGDGAPGLSLKDAHCLLKATSAQVQLIPGEAAGALSRVANSMPNVDLVLISARQDDASLAPAWFYVPRMLHGTSVVLRELPEADGGGTTRFEPVSQAEIQSRAAAGRRKAA